MADKQLVLRMEIDTKQSGSLRLSPGALGAIHSFIEAEIPQIKRFRVFAFYNTGSGRTAAAEDAGLIQRRGQQAAPPSHDVKLVIDLDVQSSLRQFGGRVDPSDGKRKDTVAEYRMVGSCQLIGSNDGQILPSRNIDAVETRDVVERVLPSGERRFAGGFDPNNRDNVNSVLQILARRILSDITLYLGEYYPITGDITAIRGGRMTMNKSFDDGMTNETQVLIWADDGGIPTGIAYANCEAMADRTVLNVYAWNTRDPDAARIVREVQNNPDVLRTMRLRATSIGLPVPMQWREGRAK
jgi:hypothetical protein